MKFRFLFAAFALLLASGCETMMQPQTPRERLVYAESAWQVAAKSAIDEAMAGTLTGENLAIVTGAMKAARVALDNWHLAPDDQTRMSATLTALATAQSLLRPFLKSPAGKVTYEPSRNPSSKFINWRGNELTAASSTS